ncbi:MAG TPA: alginate lyase family protein [Abditibacteriaceae bacterium]
MGLLLFLLMFLLSLSPIQAQETVWRSEAVFLSPARVETLKERVKNKTEPTYSAFLKLQAFADKALAREPHVPARWYVPGYYRDAKGHQDAKKGLADDANSAYGLALMFRISGEEKYAHAATNLIDAWAKLEEMDRKDDSTLSFSYHFPALIFAADLLKDWPGWPQEKQAAFRTFVRTKALPMNTMSRHNNWGSWGLVLWLSGAAYLDDKDAFDKGIVRYKEFIEKQIADDGHLPLEVIRNNGIGEHGLWYTHFSLMPLTIAAEIARVNGVDLFNYQSPNNRTLRAAFERVAPWTRDIRTFPYFKPKNADEKQKGTDYISYWEILSARWPNADATAMLQEKRPLTASHCTPFLTLTHGDLSSDRE